jgi:hypothetical protein
MELENWRKCDRTKEKSQRKTKELRVFLLEVATIIQEFHYFLAYER